MNPWRFFLGLDLGQSADFTALVAVRRTLPPGESPVKAALDVLHAERFPLGTPYPGVVEKVKGIAARPELRPVLKSEAWWTPAIQHEPAPTPVLGIDATGVGRPIVDMLERAEIAAEMHAVTITAGSESRTQHYPSNRHWTPKKDLVGCVVALLQTGRLKIAPGLKEAETLKAELLNFRATITTSGNETFAAWREKAHDDLVLALAIACWLATRPPSGSPLIVRPSPLSPYRG